MIPTLETERLILRAPTEADLPTWQRYFNNWKVIRYLSQRVPWPYPDDGVEFFYKNEILPNQGKATHYWAIIKKEDNHLIGGIELITKTRGFENRGFWLAEPYWGNGYMTEAANEVNRFAFEVLKLEKLTLANAPDNIGSRRIKEKTGARYIGRKPFKYVDPELTESEVWELTREDWLKTQNN